MKRRLASLCLAASLLAGLFGCSAPAAPDSPAATTAPTASESPAATAAPAEEPTATAAPSPTPGIPAAPAGTHWLLPPTYEVDSLEPVTYGRPLASDPYNSTKGLCTADGMVKICNWDGAMHCGLLNREGQVAVPQEYESIFCGYDQRYSLDKGVAFDSDERYFTLDETGQIEPLHPDEEVGISGTSSNGRLCWIEDEQAVYEWGGGGDAFIEFRPLDSLTGPCAAQWLATMPEDHMMPFLEGVPLVLLGADGQPISDTQYEDAGAFACGVVPVYQNGCWGYADETGTLVIPCEYDASWKSWIYEYLDGEAYTYTYEPIGCYNATEDTVVLCRDGQYALVTLAGETLIDFGACEELRPLQGDRLWAKAGGRWGLLVLDQA